MLVVDTNILFYAANRDTPLHAPCRVWLEEQRTGADAWFLTWSIVYEFVRVVTHPRVLSKPWKAKEALRFVRALQAAPGLEMLSETDRHPEVLASVLEAMPHLAGNILHDVHTAVLMKEHGVRGIATRDMDFHRFDFLEPFDPVP